MQMGGNVCEVSAFLGYCYGRTLKPSPFLAPSRRQKKKKTVIEQEKPLPHEQPKKS